MRRLPIAAALYVVMSAPLAAQPTPDPFAWMPRVTVTEAFDTPSGAHTVDRAVRTLGELARPGCRTPPPTRAVVLDWLTRHGEVAVARNAAGARDQAVRRLEAQEGPDASRLVAGLATHPVLPESQRLYRAMRLLSVIDMVAETFDRWMVLAPVRGWRAISSIATGDGIDVRNELVERYDAALDALVQRQGEANLPHALNAAAVLDGALVAEITDEQRRAFDTIAAPLRAACILVD